VTRRGDLERSSDEELMAEMCREEKLALEILYERHVDGVLALAYRMLALRGPAEEVARTRHRYLPRSPASRRDNSRVIELAYFGGDNHAEIAEMLEVPADTVKRRMRT
jgi:DNA-directed RNA polymerase specialized sigma24 family protein